MFRAPVPARRLARNAALVALLATLVAGCARPPATSAPNDPFEATNRAWFDRNMALVSAVSRDSGATEAAPPRRESGAFVRTLRNVGANLSVPSTVVNDLLQVRPDRAAQNTLRFAINSTLGLAGIFDPATAMGLAGRPSDFGETLHRWGVGEGAYVVLPVIGPSTERDALGMAVDSLLSPWDLVLTSRESRAVTGIRWAGRFAALYENADLLDANVIQTADPYAQARLLFLQARRYHLGVETEDDAFDPYDELYD